MGKDTAISWTHHTWNPHSGCAKVSAGCAHCYAAALPPGMRRGAEWGTETPRVMASEAYLRQPFAWDLAAARAGERHRVFCGSTMDWAEDRDDLDASRARIFATVEATPNLDWLLVTKRADQIMRRVPERWRGGFPKNVWILVSVEDQRAADERIPHLAEVPAVVRGLSMEPLLGPVDLSAWLWGPMGARAADVNWVITGGESGPHARPMLEEWVRDIHTQARAAGVAIHHKQMGSWWATTTGAQHKKGGDPEEWEAALRVREYPEVSCG